MITHDPEVASRAAALGADRRRTDPPVTRRHVRAHTQVLEALVGVSSRPGRLTLTLLGEALGLAALVATVSLAATANAQVVGELRPASARQVTVQAVGVAGAAGSDPAAGRRAERRAAAGRRGRRVPDPARPPRRHPVHAPSPTRRAFPPRCSRSSRPRSDCCRRSAPRSTGAPSTPGTHARADAVALLGAAAAETPRDPRPGRRPGGLHRRHGAHRDRDHPPRRAPTGSCSVASSYRRADRRSACSAGGAPPRWWSTYGRRPPTSWLVRLRWPSRPPTRPRSSAVAPPTDTTLRSRVQRDVSSLLLLLGIVTLARGRCRHREHHAALGHGARR